MEWADAFRVAFRLAHTLAAVVWVGGSIFYLVVLGPALKASGGSPRPGFEDAIARGFREVVDASIVTLLVSGVVVTFDRLSRGPIGAPYYIVLGLKLAAVAWMFYLARALGTRLGRLGRARRPSGPGGNPAPASETPRRPTSLFRWTRAPRLVLLLGLLALLLSTVLVTLYENGLRGA